MTSEIAMPTYSFRRMSTLIPRGSPTSPNSHCHRHRPQLHPSPLAPSQSRKGSRIDTVRVGYRISSVGLSSTEPQ